MKKSVIYSILLVSFFTNACFSSKEKLPEIKCKLVSSNSVTLPASGISTKFAVLDIYYTLRKKPHSSLSSTVQNYYEKIIYLPKDLKASINGKDYFVSVKKRYKSAFGKNFIYKPQSIIIGKPKEIIKAKETYITKDSLKLIEKYRTLSNGCKVFLFPKLKEYLKILEFPDKDIHLRTYNVYTIRIRELYLNNSDSATFNAEIKGDTLFLLY